MGRSQKRCASIRSAIAITVRIDDPAARLKALQAGGFQLTQNLKIPQLANLYPRVGCENGVLRIAEKDSRTEMSFPIADVSEVRLHRK